MTIDRTEPMSEQDRERAHDLETLRMLTLGRVLSVAQSMQQTSFLLATLVGKLAGGKGNASDEAAKALECDAAQRAIDRDSPLSSFVQTKKAQRKARHGKKQSK